ncbi:TlpA family protein disulfide reductase [Candidatus Poribacteria bacterium]|nr:TlpA family protein disulfide reductase [Candidatus Poribacteria bacterium]
MEKTSTKKNNSTDSDSQTQDKPKGKTYKNLVDDQNISFENFTGHVLLIDFWATWCPPCRMEIPWFVEFQDKFKDKKFSVIGISVDRGGEAAVKNFIQQYKINYPVIMATQELIKEYEGVLGQPIRSIPTTFIKDKSGQVVQTHIGVPRSADPKGLFEQEIAKLLGEG